MTIIVAFETSGRNAANTIKRPVRISMFMVRSLFEWQLLLAIIVSPPSDTPNRPVSDAAASCKKNFNKLGVAKNGAPRARSRTSRKLLPMQHREIPWTEKEFPAEALIVSGRRKAVQLRFDED